jgi:hypothetical protein
MVFRFSSLLFLNLIMIFDRIIIQSSKSLWKILSFYVIESREDNHLFNLLGFQANVFLKKTFCNSIDIIIILHSFKNVYWCCIPAFINLVVILFIELFLVYFTQLSDILTHLSSFRVVPKNSNLDIYEDLAFRLRGSKLKTGGWSLKRESYLDKVWGIHNLN